MRSGRMQGIKAEIMDEAAMRRAITRISYEIIERNSGTADLCVVGVRRRGAELAERIAHRIGEIENCTVPTAFLDITDYRDDRPGRKAQGVPVLEPAVPVTDRHLVLVDDVLFTGRTARAAMDAIMDMGRPRTLQLAVLVDRGHRELPISPDFVGKNVPTSHSETVEVHTTGFDGENRVVILQNV